MRNIEWHVQLLAVLMAAGTLFASFGLLIAGAVLMPALFFIPFTNNSFSVGPAESVLLAFGSLAVIFAVCNLILGLSAAYGLLKRQPWGRWLGILDNMVSLMSFPIGTALGIYGLWVLLPQDAADYLNSSEKELKLA